MISLRYLHKLKRVLMSKILPIVIKLEEFTKYSILSLIWFICSRNKLRKLKL